MLKLSADFIFDGIRFLPKDTVLIVDDSFKICFISKRQDYPDIDFYYDGIICPGFINTHCHLELSHLYQQIERHSELPDFIKSITHLRDTFSTEEIVAAAYKADQEMYQNGIVAVGDICNTKNTIGIKLNSNIKYHSFIELFDIRFSDCNETLSIGLELLKNHQENGLLASIVPHAPYSCSLELFEYLSTLKSNAPISIHNQESWYEHEFITERSGILFERFQQQHFNLDRLPQHAHSSLVALLPYYKKFEKLILVHNTFTSRDDIKIATDNIQNLFWCFCVRANEFISDCYPPLEFFDKNANIVLGTDSLASNYSLNIFEEMCVIQKEYKNISLENLLLWSTSNGAAALGIDQDFGRIKVGKKPGLNFIKIDEDKNMIQHYFIPNQIQNGTRV
ncbi:MAG: amidohydrolase family protein [Sediminibacterium sp.]|nr:amidohydrolase family protein [Sediminibacterium sp.]